MLKVKPSIDRRKKTSKSFAAALSRPSVLFPPSVSVAAKSTGIWRMTPEEQKIVVAGVRVRVIQMVFLLLCVAKPDETTEKSTEKQPNGRER